MVKKQFSLIRDGGSFHMTPMNNLQVEAGTVDKVNFKSCYIKFSAHIESETDKPLRDIKLMFLNMRRVVSDSIGNGILKKDLISIQDIPDNVNETGKAFVSIEFNMFLEPKITKKLLVSHLNQLCAKVELSALKYDKLKLIKTKKYGKKSC